MPDLYLNRKENQTIWIGENVTITVEKIQGDRVNLLVRAPKEIAVDREEVRVRKAEFSCKAKLMA